MFPVWGKPGREVWLNRNQTARGGLGMSRLHVDQSRLKIDLRPIHSLDLRSAKAGKRADRKEGNHAIRRGFENLDDLIHAQDADFSVNVLGNG